MTARAPFSPHFGVAQTIAVTTTSQSVTIGRENKNLCLSNTGAAVCYVRTGTGVQAATAADYAVLPNSQVVITKDHESDTLGVIGVAATTLHVIPGEGW
jgi:hypothetical protein